MKRRVIQLETGEWKVQYKHWWSPWLTFSSPTGPDSPAGDHTFDSAELAEAAFIKHQASTMSPKVLYMREF